MSSTLEDQADRDPEQAVAANPFWYHTMEVAPGALTPGWFDLRPIVGKLPWPDVSGKRCLDVGTADGFFAFELERRGAAAVVGTDLADHDLWDWPLRLRDRGVDFLRSVAGPEKGVGFRIARDLRGSAVEGVQISAYDLSPETIGRFDVVVCGSLLLHLRDPVRALEAMRSVCSGHLLVTNQVSLTLSLLRRTPAARVDGVSDRCQWWVPNPKGHEHMVRAAGFEIEDSSRVYAVPFGSAHPAKRSLRRRLVQRALARGEGVPHHAILAHPSV